MNEQEFQIELSVFLYLLCSLVVVVVVIVVVVVCKYPLMIFWSKQSFDYHTTFKLTYHFHLLDSFAQHVQ